VSLPAIATASAEIARVVRRARAAAAAQRYRRLLLEVIDLAIEECEEINLATPDGQPAAAAPACVADLLEQPPADTVDAHGMLLDLRARFMAGSPMSAAEEAAWLAGDEPRLACRRERRW